MTTNPFQEPAYLEHNRARFEHLASLNLPLNNRTVLEVGAGVGDHTSFFLDRGCKVTTSDGRESNVACLSTRYPELEVIQLDVENPGDFNREFEVVYCYGLLYHLSNPITSLHTLSSWCSGLLLLETCVGPSYHGWQSMTEDVNNPADSISGIGCRPCRRYLYEVLNNNFSHVYTPVTQPNHGDFPTDWTVSFSEQQTIRTILVASRQKLDNPSLAEELLLHQTKI